MRGGSHRHRRSADGRAGGWTDSLLKQRLVLSGLRCTAQARDLSTRGRSWSVSFWSMLAAVRCAYVLTFCRTPATTSISSGATGRLGKTAAEMCFCNSRQISESWRCSSMRPRWGGPFNAPRSLSPHPRSPVGLLGSAASTRRPPASSARARGVAVAGATEAPATRSPCCRRPGDSSCVAVDAAV